MLPAQTIQFISAKSGEPLSKVTVLDEKGAVLASSDISGKIQKETLLPVQQKYILIYENYTIGYLNEKDVNSEIIRLNDRVSNIEAVTIKNNKKAKYLYVRGNFNVYLTNDKNLNVYADGIVTYVFDNQTRKLKSSRLEQYRSFLKSDQKLDRKNLGTAVFDSFLEIPDLSDAGRMNEIKTESKNDYKEVETADRTKMEYKVQNLQKKDFAFLGYRFYDFNYLDALSFSKGSKNLRDFQEYYQTSTIKMKHKSEPEYHQLVTYSTFIPTEISFGDTDDIPKITLKPKKSFYTFQFWKANGFPNMQPVFSTFFEDSLKEQPNTAKK